MKRNSRLSHTVWDCKYHVVWIPNTAARFCMENYGITWEMCFMNWRQREGRIIEGDLCIDHIHKCIAIPPKHFVSEVVSFIKGKSAIAIARDVGGKARNFVGQSFWARGYYVQWVVMRM